MPYRQEGELVPFTAWPWMHTITNLDKKYFTQDYHYLYAYFKKDYLWVYWDSEVMNRLSSSIYAQYKDTIEDIYLPFSQKAQELEQFYLDTYEEKLDEYSTTKLQEFIKRLWQKHTAMWKLSIFIDSFDPGIDQQEIAKISAIHHFTAEETAVLLTPTQLTFVSERLLEFYQLLRGSKKTNLKQIVSGAAMQAHRKKFDYYQYSYAHVHHLTTEQIMNEIQELGHTTLEQEYRKLKEYSKEQKQKIGRILQKHHLKQNPLNFFRQLTYWREHRKKVNLMGVHIWHKIFDTIEKKTGISKRYLEYANHDEFNKIVEGKIPAKELQERYEQGVMIHVERDRYALLVGAKAMTQKIECEKRIILENSAELKGQIACQGIARGRVKVVISREDFAQFKEGDILVAGMTRPEHVPLMKKAAAIVTNEGGITCHAAIVSRELGKPCIIGTKCATEVLKDGEMVEVDAEKGIIKKIKS